VVIGPTNVGKSALVATLTGATPTVSEAPFTTWEPTPGMMAFEDIQIQLIDTPPLEGDYIDAQLFDLIRRADMALLVLDLQTYPVQQLEDTISVLREHRIAPAHVEEGLEGENGEDAPRVTRVPMLVLANKADDAESDEVFQIFCELLEGEWPLLPVSAATGRNLEAMKRAVFERLEVIRIYSKRPGKPPDLDVPFVMERGGTVDELAGKVHKDFAEHLKAARVWGHGVHDGQLVSRDHILHDGDIVELRI
jgi:ribosome-interacting GTPase 1